MGSINRQHLLSRIKISDDYTKNRHQERQWPFLTTLEHSDTTPKRCVANVLERFRNVPDLIFGTISYRS